ncbi:hypothetical protein [Methanoculleus chikugoensis]|uniref:hypothetical protein n=1 Tax=Methanoculleus chikugoensis TaxID=118126 RepID=UPI001FB552B0|nr:hypothetical protein [Methanoculleus chikugoensis]
MEFATTLLIAVGLAMDAFAVSISGGAGLREDRLRWAVIAGALFGGFQAGMPMLGWLGGGWGGSPRSSEPTAPGSPSCCSP